MDPKTCFFLRVPSIASSVAQALLRLMLLLSGPSKTTTSALARIGLLGLQIDLNIPCWPFRAEEYSGYYFFCTATICKTQSPGHKIEKTQSPGHCKRGKSEMFRFVLVGRFLHSSGPKKDRGPLQIGTRSPFTSSNPSYSAAISASSNLRKCIGKIAVSASSQQQQSQASWGRLEMKPKKHKCHDSGTLITSLQALLSKTTSSEIVTFQHHRI